MSQSQNVKRYGGAPRILTSLENELRECQDDYKEDGSEVRSQGFWANV